MNIPKSLVLIASILVFLAPNSFAQRGEFIYFSPPTYAQVIRDEIMLQKRNPPDEIDELINKFNRNVNHWNDYAADQGGAGGARRFFKGWVNPIVDYPLNAFGVPLSALPKMRDWVDEKAFEGAAKKYSLTRDFEVRETFERTATYIVNEHCGKNIECSEKVFERLLDDREVRSQIGEADASGAFDEAQTRAYVKAAIGKVTRENAGITATINNFELTVNAAMEKSYKLIIGGFKQVNINQQRIIRNTAVILNIQQQHTIALTNLQATLDFNFQKIDQKVENVIALQQENLFLSQAISAGIQVIDTRIVNLSLDIAEIRATQINEIFHNSPIDQKIKILLNTESSISQLIIGREGGDEYRKQLIVNLKAIKLRQDVVATAQIIAQWGSVGREALLVFCRECPEEVAVGVNIGLQVTDIVGNAVSGNYSKAVLTGLGIFRKPEPSPELKMLIQISRELRRLERNMNAQFKGVHEHLFALEENLGQRLEIIDLKIDQLAREVLISRVRIMDALSGIDTKLNYIVNQNECIKDIVLVLSNQQNQDMCKVPTAELNKRFSENSIGSFQDLDNFYRGGTCANCIGTLFDVSNISLLKSSFFRYAQCNSEGQDNKARPDRMYEFIYEVLFDEERENPASISSLLFLPASVPAIESIREEIEKQEASKLMQLAPEDQYYRNYRSVMTYTGYVLSMFSFMELYDDGHLITPDGIFQNPGFTRERAKKMVVVLEDLLALLNHTIIQQSLMAGNGTFGKIDRLLSEANNIRTGPEAQVYFTLADLFAYNSYVRKNYSAYLLDKAIGYERLVALVETAALGERPQRIIFPGYSVLLSQNSQSNLTLAVSLSNSTEPTENVELFRTYLPIINDKIDEEIYKQNMEFAFPASIVELESMKKAVVGKLAEMKMITSPELDDPNANFTREDLMTLMREFALHQTAETIASIQGGEE